MPYDHEYAGYRAVQRLSQSPHIHATLARFHVNPQHFTLQLPPMVAVSALASVAEKPQRVLVIDGSWCETPLMPTTNALVGYISVAAVLLDVQRLRDLSTHRPIDPQIFQTLTTTVAIEAVIPSSDILVDQFARPADGLRRCFYDILGTLRHDRAGESLRETYEALLAYKTVRVQPQRCPYDGDGCDQQHSIYRHAAGMYACACPQQRDLYSTDALRLAEDLPRFGSNAAVLSQCMHIFEHLWLIHYLRMLEQQEDWATLTTTLFVLDGPLAIFGSAGWLSHSIRCELRRINQRVQAAMNIPHWRIPVIGIEKTGQFVHYFAVIDQQVAIPPQTLCLLSDHFIKQAILNKTSSEQYGHNNYYGSKGLYKTAQNTRIVWTLATDDPLVDGVEDQSRLPMIATVLDELYSAQYAHALLPLIAAHAAAALPLELSGRVFPHLMA